MVGNLEKQNGSREKKLRNISLKQIIKYWGWTYACTDVINGSWLISIILQPKSKKNENISDKAILCSVDLSEDENYV